MALYKEIELPNGVTVRYHRVVRVDTITNIQNTIEVASYTNESKREQEKENLALDGNGAYMFAGTSVYIETTMHVAPYDQTMTVESAYEWLKANVAEFEGANDVFEEEDEADESATGN